ncbi:TIGR03621 family F420-dependent LLM class oxidoreductase [Nocardia asteroides]|uniref:TIGR03621 family F420-dependent LLM class oxidoreductase n=1 Tax=Nocardia asteroides TaxID=1824 RepID=UPI001E39EF86|nr:TIGR03621 family F420-dependent LLM class oxidoreductase [Nocardia asteroides]UGT62349.1 TIGR03621 family F420-dependent LLM class oxidoreductase [Nocardia asteroides]
MIASGSRAEWAAKCRRAEELGFDVLGVADHLGMPAPFPSLVLAAEVTETPRLTTFVLNTPFYNPVLLAREIATVDGITGGRLELGVGAGYVREEFDAAAIPFGTGGARIAQLAEALRTIGELLADPGYQPRPARPGGPPVLIAGWGDKLLGLAAEHADIIGFTGAAAATHGGPLVAAGPAAYGERIGTARELLGARADDVEFNLLIQKVAAPGEREALLEQFGAMLPAEIAGRPEELPILLVGTPREMAERLRERRERWGFGYITVLEDSMETFAPVIPLLR